MKVFPPEYYCAVGDDISPTHSLSWWDNSASVMGEQGVCDYCGADQNHEAPKGWQIADIVARWKTQHGYDGEES